MTLGLGQPLGHRQAALLGLDHGEFLAAIAQHVVGNILPGAFAATLQSAQGDHLAPHPTGLHQAPSGFLQGRVDQFGAGFGFVHARAPASMFMIRRIMVSLLAGSDSATSRVKAARPTSLITGSPDSSSRRPLR